MTSLIVEEYNILIVGAKKVGKKTFIEKRAEQESVYERPREYINGEKIIYDYIKPEYGLINTIKADGYLIMIDLTRRITLKKAKEYIEKLRREKNNASIVLLGNKKDINYKEIDDKEIEDIVKKYELIKYSKISTLNNKNMDEGIETLIISIKLKKNKVIIKIILMIIISVIIVIGFTGLMYIFYGKV